jgi:hypothetical protein
LLGFVVDVAVVVVVVAVVVIVVAATAEAALRLPRGMPSSTRRTTSICA